MPSNLINNLNKIILVGPDGVGKTTFAKEIESQGYRYIKASALDSDDKIECSVKVLDNIGLDEKVVCDRFYFPDDLIYSKLIAGTENDLTFEDWKPVSDKLNELGFVVLYLTHDIEVIKERIRSRGDEFIDESQIVGIVEMYEDLIAKVEKQNTVVRIDMSKE